MTTNALKLQRPAKVLQVAIIEWTYGSTRPRKRIYVCSAHTRAETATGGGHLYQPRIVVLGNVRRSDIPGDFELTIKNQGWLELEEYGPSYDHVGYASLAHLLQAHPAVLNAGTVTLYDEGLAPSGDVTVSNALRAKIVGVANVCAYSITLRCQQSADLARKTLPRLSVGPDLRDAGIVDPKLAENEVCPVSLGDCELRIPEYTLPAHLKFMGGIFGWDVPSVPLVPYGKEGSTHNTFLDAVITETGGGLTVPGLGLTTPTGYVDLGDRIARLYSGWPSADGGSWYNGYEFGLWEDGDRGFVGAYYGAMPWAQVPCVPVPINDAAGNLLKATDKDPNSYATLAASQTAYFELGKMPAFGRISLNTTDSGTFITPPTKVDYEGANRPVGLKVCVLACLPDGKPAPTGAASLTLSFCYPDGALWIPSGGFMSQTSMLLPTVNKSSLIQYLNLPYQTGSGAFGDQGWAGTKFQQWDFSAGSSSDINDPDYPIWPGSENYANKPMRIAVKNNASNACYIAGVVLLVGCRLNREPSTSTMSRHFKKKKNLGKAYYTIETTKGKPKWGTDWIKDPVANTGTEDAETLASMLGEQGRSGWGRGRGSSVEKRRKGWPSTFDSNVYASMPLIGDDASGTYTGTAGATLRDPIHLARYYMRAYGGLTDAQIRTSGQLGGYPHARLAMQNFKGSGTATIPLPIAAFSFDTKSSVEDACSAILENAFGTRVVKMRDGTYGFFPWLPVAATVSTYTARTYSSTPLDVLRLIPKQGDGSPDLDYGMDESEPVLNQLAITYGGKYPRVARCRKTGGSWVTDDGYGNQWNGGLVPWSAGQTIADLCARSEDYYGLQDEVQFQMIEVEDRDAVVTEALYHLAREWMPPINLRMTGLLPLHDLEYGHLFRLSDDLQTEWGLVPIYWGAGASWDNLWWECLGSTENPANGTFEISARWVPYYVGDVTRGVIWGGGDDVSLPE